MHPFTNSLTTYHNLINNTEYAGARTRTKLELRKFYLIIHLRVHVVVALTFTRTRTHVRFCARTRIRVRDGPQRVSQLLYFVRVQPHPFVRDSYAFPEASAKELRVGVE